MRTSASLVLLACCCAALAACTAAAPSGPSNNVTTPSVGKPPLPVSGQAALSSEAFTPYAALGISSDDGLAPAESQYTLIGPCMSAAGYPGVTVNDGIVPTSFPIGGSLAFAQPWGGWGYLGTAEAQQYGFRYPLGAALTTLGIGLGAAPPSPPSVPAAEQAAASKCGTIIQDFANVTQKGPLAGIIALGNDIATDVQRDPAVTAATRAWSACMARNGYTFSGPQNVGMTEFQAMYGGRFISPSTQVSAAANRAQIAVAATDAGCTQASDLAGIYFAVQANYEQQLVTANQQALDTAVSQYRSAYATELNKLPALLGTTKAQPFRPARPASRHAG